METGAHPREQLSAYLDGALGPADRAAVEAHLGGCPDCRARHAELRATSALLRALPDPVPSRRLMPRLAGPPAWLAPLRTLATMASGVSVFLFIASALAANLTSLATPSALSAPAAGGATSASSTAERADASPPARAAAPAAPSPAALTDSAAKQQATASPGFALNAASPAPADARTSSTGLADAREGARSPATNPWLWLALAVISGAAALALQRRLRRA